MFVYATPDKSEVCVSSTLRQDKALKSYYEGQNLFCPHKPWRRPDFLTIQSYFVTTDAKTLRLCHFRWLQRRTVTMVDAKRPILFALLLDMKRCSKTCKVKVPPQVRLRQSGQSMGTCLCSQISKSSNPTTFPLGCQVSRNSIHMSKHCGPISTKGVWPWLAIKNLLNLFTKFSNSVRLLLWMHHHQPSSDQSAPRGCGIRLRSEFEGSSSLNLFTRMRAAPPVDRSWS